jgi:hypothetical protein
MKQAQLKLDEGDLSKAIQIESSILQWSVELGKVSLTLDRIKNQLAGLYEARAKTLESVVKEAGFDINKIQNISFNPETGDLRFNIVPSEVEETPDSL